MNNNTEELFKYLIQLHCNDLNKYMPFMFETLEDYTMILFPEGLLGTESFVREMIDTEIIPEDNWEQVEIVGWLYQYYISEEKDEIFKNLKKNVKINQDTLPAATQLFTPNWIVRYMVENSLGRLWLESYPDSQIRDNWEYYLDDADQSEETIRQLNEIRYQNVNPEEITFLDPACGSGHILVYAFDVFYEMYEEKGYMSSEIPKLILENNLYGIDVDDRAAQLASFSVLMKAREKSRRIFRQQAKLNVISIQDSSWLTETFIDSIANNEVEKSKLIEVKDKFNNAKEFGSLIDPTSISTDHLKEIFNRYSNEQTNLLDVYQRERAENEFPRLLQQIAILNKKYDVVCMNPPYMGRKSMNSDLTKYLNNNYPTTKADLFAVFIEKGFELTNVNGFNANVTMQSWMFLSSYEKMRTEILDNKTINTLLHMDNNVMGIAFGTVATVFRNGLVSGHEGKFTEVKNIDVVDDRPSYFPIVENRNGSMASKGFNKIPGSPIAYWASSGILENFESGIPLGKISYPRQGMATTNNKRFLRQWYEISIEKIGFGLESEEETVGNYKWFPYNKGGGFRKWFGNNEFVVNFKSKGEEICQYIDSHSSVDHKGRVINRDKYFKESITWSKISSGNISFRYKPKGFIFDVAGTSIFGEKEDLIWLIAVLNSRVVLQILKYLSPTLNFEVGHISSIPIIDITSYKNRVKNIVDQNILISNIDWDSFETSWDFENHPLLTYKENTIESSFNTWQDFSENQFNQLKSNEEELNRIFIEIYGLEDELTPEVADKDVTVRKADLERDIKSFISYAVGCALGRYSLDEDGLIYAGGEFDGSRYQTFPVDENNILPILSDAYFEDDIVSLFIHFVETVYGTDTLEENLTFVAEAIGKRKNETAREAIRRYFLNNFYKDHVQTYKKHPIYWQFTSGKEKAFNCLIYMHRYDKTTLSRIRTDYLHDVQARYETIKNDLQYVIDSDADATEIRNAKKELTSVDKKIAELKAYDEKLHHMADMQIEIDLDDGVKVNYKKFEGLVAKI